MDLSKQAWIGVPRRYAAEISASEARSAKTQTVPHTALLIHHNPEVVGCWLLWPSNCSSSTAPRLSWTSWTSSFLGRSLGEFENFKCSVRSMMQRLTRAGRTGQALQPQCGPPGGTKRA